MSPFITQHCLDQLQLHAPGIGVKGAKNAWAKGRVVPRDLAAALTGRKPSRKDNRSEYRGVRFGDNSGLLVRNNDAVVTYLRLGTEAHDILWT